MTKAKKVETTKIDIPFAGTVEIIEDVEIADHKLAGQDAPLTDMIYGTTKPREALSTDVLPESTGQTQGLMSPLQRFVNLYEPGELVMRQNFRKHLLEVLEDLKYSEIER
jgi:hypothetical protein